MAKPTIHCLKVTPEFFPAIACGDKNFEVRVNDRNFKTGDMLVLQEWDNGYTREAVTKIVTYTLYGGRFGVQDGYVVMGLRDYSQSEGEGP